MADDRRRQEDAEAAGGEEDWTTATVKRQRTAPEDKEIKEEQEEEHEDGGGWGRDDVGEDILAWLTDLDDEAVRDIMMNLFEPPSEATLAGKVCFAADSQFSSSSSLSSYITINTGNEESCGSSFSDAPSVMAGVSPSDSWLPSPEMFDWGFLADDDGDNVLAKFIGTDSL